MDIRIFPKNELPIALGTVRATDSLPTRDQDRFLRALSRLHGQDIDPRTLPAPSTPEVALAIQNPHRRKRLVELAIVMSMIGRFPAVAERYRALGSLPRGSFGRAYYEHCRSRNFPFPGEASGIPIPPLGSPGQRAA